MSYRPLGLGLLARARLLFWLLAAPLVLSCGGGTYVAGIEGTGDTAISSGSVSGFGSVYVNGTRYDTDSADITIDGRPATEDELAVGMVVTIKGARDSQTNEGVAHEVIAEHALRGSVTAVEQVGSGMLELTVLGQSVLVQAETALEGVDFAELEVGQRLAVSGFTDGDGRWLATHLALQDAVSGPAEFEVEGPITGINRAQATIAINALTVDVSGVATVEFTEGERVEVRGQRLNNRGHLVATQLVAVAGLTLAEGAQVELEGLIENFTSAAQFTVNGITVDASDAQIHKGALQQLSEGVHVSLTATASTRGAVQAEVIELLLPSQVRVEGPVDSVDVASGRIEVMGVTFFADRYTGYEDRSPAANRQINLRGLSIGNQVEIFAREVDDRHVITRLRRQNSGQGQAAVSIESSVVEVLSSTSFTLLGLIIDASDAAQGLDLVPTLQAGDVVKVEGRMTGNATFTAESVELLPSMGCQQQMPAWLGCILQDKNPHF